MSNLKVKATVTLCYDFRNSSSWEQFIMLIDMLYSLRMATWDCAYNYDSKMKLKEDY